MPQIRRLTRQQIGKALKARQIPQREIARCAGVSQGYVSRVFARKHRTGRAENVWLVLDRAINGPAAPCSTPGGRLFLQHIGLA